LFHCSPGAEVDSASANHTAGKATVAHFKWPFADDTEQEFRAKTLRIHTTPIAFASSTWTARSRLTVTP
jgi:hypothetical protein